MCPVSSVFAKESFDEISSDRILDSRRFISDDIGSIDVKFVYKSIVKISDIPNEVIELRGSNVRVFKENDVYTAEFVSGYPKYYQDSVGDWYYLYYSTTTSNKFDSRKIFTLFSSVKADSSDFFTSSGVDGVVKNELGDYTTWSNARGGAGTGASDNYTSASSGSLLYCKGYKTSWVKLWRNIFVFDTSSLTADAEISSATFSVYGSNKTSSHDTSSDWNVALATSSPASTDALVSGDFDSLTFSRISDSDISYDSFDTSGYNDWTLNASGLSSIDKEGYTKLGAMFACDMDNDEPDDSSEHTTQLRIYTDNDGSNMPKLVVVYTISGGGETELGDVLIIENFDVYVKTQYYFYGILAFLMVIYILWKK